MKESKYYQPQLEEFCVGFEYQRYVERDFDEGSCTWEDKIFPEEGLCTGTIEHPNIVEIFYENYLEDVRVKLLDSQDIIDCGFKKLYEDTYELTINEFRGRTNVKVHLVIRKTLLICIGDSETPYSDWLTLFTGTIKNKTEFKKTLMMLGITNNKE